MPAKPQKPVNPNHNDSVEVGMHIRKVRKMRGLTIKQLATRVGVTESYISQLEHDKVNPSLGTLKNISHVLDVNMVDFFNCDTVDAKIVVRKNERLDFGYPAAKFYSQLLAVDIANKAMEPIYSVIAPGGDTMEAYRHRGEEFGVVIKGQLLLVVDGTEYHLEAGDAFYFNSERLHRTSNPGSVTTEVVWVITPPTY